MTDERSLQFSIVGFAIAVVAVAVGAATGLAFVPVVGSYLGMLAGGLVAGLAIEDRPVVEGGLAAALVNLGILAAGGVIGNGPIAGLSAIGSIAPTTLVLSLVLSFAIGAFGAHFGDDIRDGLTAPVEESPSGSTDLRVPAESRTDEQTAEREAHEERSTTDATDESSSSSAETAESEELELERE